MKPIVLAGALLAALVLGAGVLYRSGIVQVNRPGAATYPVRGIDVSHHQGRIDWPRVGQSGVEFAFIKATEGRDFSDSRFPENWSGADAAGIARGAYHFFTFCTSGKAQAEHFLRIVPPVAGALAPVADVEFVGNCTRHPSMEAVRAELVVFLEEVERAWGAAPIIYTTPEAHRRLLGAGFERHPLWLRSVFSQPEPDAYGGWSVWQFSETGAVPGIRGPVDLNALRPGFDLETLRVGGP